jgi:hypothetical protein
MYIMSSDALCALCEAALTEGRTFISYLGERREHITIPAGSVWPNPGLNT